MFTTSNLMRRAAFWGLIWTILVLLFWASFYLVYGTVPTVTHFQLTNSVKLELPLALPRYFDALFVALFATLIVYLMAKYRARGDEKDAREDYVVDPILKRDLVYLILFQLFFMAVHAIFLIKAQVQLIPLLITWFLAFLLFDISDITIRDSHSNYVIASLLYALSIAVLYGMFYGLIYVAVLIIVIKPIYTLTRNWYAQAIGTA